ncbi:hypothetical protein AKJ38_01970 [candidate division MSBL1 archaeon SCGC-AAA259I14]|uniref:Uncharacterized protein n=1 Tax=candidate division MSBL1 archaeon SCGC-AAA259I14 TaxID=1698268 RepID=A0A133US71_9EURY|nr:hypothetical protein AKJ38_01970 [candidate division MSBL1 archaeon SCGC-AAA259I14]
MSWKSGFGAILSTWGVVSLLVTMSLIIKISGTLETTYSALIGILGLVSSILIILLGISVVSLDSEIERLKTRTKKTRSGTNKIVRKIKSLEKKIES